MYTDYFKLKENPFSITPDPRYLYLSQQHREGLAHLQYSLGGNGGFVLLTGEVGTGKTTLYRSLLTELPAEYELALILNSLLNAEELLVAICGELEIPYEDDDGLNDLINNLNDHLLDAHTAGRHVLLIVDEAQNLRIEVLEQLRLLTNLETEKRKLLQIILIGQPELRTILARKDLRQLSQRITAQYHLGAISKREIGAYIQHRLLIGGQQQPVFDKAAIKAVHSLSGGIPRMINMICDRALLGAYTNSSFHVDKHVVKKAAAEILYVSSAAMEAGQKYRIGRWALALTILLTLGAGLYTGIISPGKSALEPPMQTLAKDLPAISQPPAPSTPLITQRPITAPDPVTQIPRPIAPPEARIIVSADPKTPPPPDPVPAIVAENNPATTIANRSESHAPHIESVPISPPDPVELPEELVDVVPAETSPVDALSILLPQDEGIDGLDAANAGLFAYWQQDYMSLSGATLCDRAARAGLRCLQKTHGNWSTLRSFNRPAIITLVGPSQVPRHAVVSKLGLTEVTLDLGAKRKILKIDELLPFWQGEFVLLWEPPKAMGELTEIWPDTESPAVRWLRAQLQTLMNTATRGNDADNAHFDPELKRQVSFFQRSLDLSVDGVAGAQSIIQINSLLGDARIPRLHPARIPLTLQEFVPQAPATLQPSESAAPPPSLEATAGQSSDQNTAGEARKTPLVDPPEYELAPSNADQQGNGLQDLF